MVSNMMMLKKLRSPMAKPRPMKSAITKQFFAGHGELKRDTSQNPVQQCQVRQQEDNLGTDARCGDTHGQVKDVVSEHASLKLSVLEQSLPKTFKKLRNKDNS